MRASALIFSFLLLFGVNASAQDTITVMHYNLLNYGNTTTWCSQTNNNISDKAAAMGIICSFLTPDILTVNEVGANSFAPAHFLNNVLNIHGVNYYQSSTLTNLSTGDLANFLYYDSRKFVLHSQHALATNLRDINIYRLYHNDTNLHVHQDTAILYVITTHLKAGNSSSDRVERAAMVKILMDSSVLWSGYPAILTGDLNLYTSNEPAWQDLTEPADTTGERFYDPLDMPGNWQNNQSFASIHTQSTRATSNGCAAGGGLDDRFDFILLNRELKQNPGFFYYMPGSYRTPGNDGNHLNLSINSGTNNSAPSLIIQALYDASDHLPVLMDLILQPSTQGVKKPVAGNGISRIAYIDGVFELSFEYPALLKNIVIVDLSGRIIFYEATGGEPMNSYRFKPGVQLNPGVYILRATDASGRSYNGKVMVK